jgi:hypothetical protein
MTEQFTVRVRFIPPGVRIANPSEQQLVREILEKSRILNPAGEVREIDVEIAARVPAGTSLVAAHATWNAPYFPELQTPDGLPRQLLEAITPEDLLRVEVSLIQRRCPGMGSHFGFKGDYLSLLILVKTKSLWDARQDRAK